MQKCPGDLKIANRESSNFILRDNMHDYVSFSINLDIRVTPSSYASTALCEAFKLPYSLFLTSRTFVFDVILPFPA